jgi:hypothetical protein
MMQNHLPLAFKCVFCISIIHIDPVAIMTAFGHYVFCIARSESSLFAFLSVVIIIAATIYVFHQLLMAIVTLHHLIIMIIRIIIMIIITVVTLVREPTISTD